MPRSSNVPICPDQIFVAGHRKDVLAARRHKSRKSKTEIDDSATADSLGSHLLKFCAFCVFLRQDFRLRPGRTAPTSSRSALAPTRLKQKATDPATIRSMQHFPGRFRQLCQHPALGSQNPQSSRPYSRATLRDRQFRATLRPLHRPPTSYQPSAYTRSRTSHFLLSVAAATIVNRTGIFADALICVLDELFAHISDH
jgi:ribosomal protein L34